MPTRPKIPFGDNEDMRVVQEAFDGIPLISLASVPDFIAAGTNTNTFRLQWRSNRATIVPARFGPPIAALVVRCVEIGDETGNPGNIRPILNFEYDSRTGDVILYEPTGLTADTKYTLTVMFIAGE